MVIGAVGMSPNVKIETRMRDNADARPVTDPRYPSSASLTIAIGAAGMWPDRLKTMDH